jgi:hypothetical protein
LSEKEANELQALGDMRFSEREYADLSTEKGEDYSPPVDIEARLQALDRRASVARQIINCLG